MFQGKARSAIAVAVNVAKHHPNPVDVLSLSMELGISISYIEQIMCYLRRGKIIEGLRGPGGGYRLRKNPSDVSISDISSAMDMEKEEFENPTVRKAFSRIVSKEHDLFKTLSLSELIA